jgi:N-methylhydantoinase A
MRVGVEVGGTFTDLVVVHKGSIRVAKVPSTPAAPDVGALNAIAAAGIALNEISDLVHGSTVATNAVLERKGGRIAVFVTRGTRDLFHLQRQDRTAIYDLNYRKPDPVVDRADICEVAERLAPDGSVVDALHDGDLEQTVRAFLATANFDAVAICLLHSYANPSHEQQVARAIRRVSPNMPVTCSSDVSPEFREYERASTTALAAFVQPVIAGYLQRLEQQLGRDGFAGNFSIMQSNGGRIPAKGMARNAISGLFSGPAAGVVGAMRTASRSGFNNIITLDMGGTSTDVSLVAEANPALSPQTMIDGLPVRTPVIDIATVGAGGGSIAWLDDGGLLRVGPRSAGAQPGPACYGRGGKLPTVTDAHLVRGTLQSESFLGGTMSVDQNASSQALSALAKSLELSERLLADSVIRIAEGNIVRAIQQVSTERGLDPREFILVPFGGAGPLHAARVAEELGINTILVPQNAGVLSAAGLLMSDYVHYQSRTQRLTLNDNAIEQIYSILTELRDSASQHLSSLGVQGELRYEQILEMRYVGQAFELSVTLPADPEQPGCEQIRKLFHDAHHRVFEFSKPPEDPVEIVSYRVGVHASVEQFPFTPFMSSRGTAATRTINITDNGESIDCTVLPRSNVDDKGITGAALIEDGTATVYVPTGWRGRTDEIGNLILERDQP